MKANKVIDRQEIMCRRFSFIEEKQMNGIQFLKDWLSRVLFHLLIP